MAAILNGLLRWLWLLGHLRQIRWPLGQSWPKQPATWQKTGAATSLNVDVMALAAMLAMA